MQVLPFRGGEVASWALYRSELGVSWARAVAVFALVKVVDSATMLLVGLGGAAVLALRSGSATLGGATSLLVFAGALALLLFPWAGAGILARLANRFPEESKRRSSIRELALGLEIARSRPALYGFAILGAFAFLALHLAALSLLMRGIRLEASWSGLAFASLTSVLTAGILPSPAGTFGPMESGFAAGLVFDGLPLALGILAGAVLHLLTTLVAGFVGLDVFFRRSKARLPEEREDEEAPRS